jgi:uncharacterized protein (TIGR02117 family)
MFYLLSIFILFPVLFVFIYIVIASLIKYWVVNPSFIETKNGIEVILITNGGHTDIVLPVETDIFDWGSFLDMGEFEEGNKSYIAIGWGNKKFYLEAGQRGNSITLAMAIEAIFGLGPSVMKVFCLEEKPKVENQQMQTSFFVNKEEYMALVDYIKGYFISTNYENRIIALEHVEITYCEGLNYNFFNARSSYHIFKNCNCWVNEVLKAAGIKTPIWTPFADGLTFHINPVRKSVFNNDYTFLLALVKAVTFGNWDEELT